MKTYETSTNIANVINVGTYWGPFNYDDLWGEEERIEREDEGNFVCDDYDSRKFKDTIVKEVNRVLDDAKPLEEYGVVSIKATSMGSPKEYNFRDDWLDLEFTVEDDFLDRAEKAIFDPEYHDLLEKFIRENWCSRDGFVSSMPAQDLDEMHKVFEMVRTETCGIDDMRAFGSIIQLLREIEKHENRMSSEDGLIEGSLTEQLYLNISENYLLGDFCTILSREEAEKIYPSLFLGVIDDARKQLDEGLEKYRFSGVGEDAINKAEEVVKERHKRLDAYCKKMHEEVEWFHPGNPDEVRERLGELKEAYSEEFGDFPTRAKLGKPDVPGQIKMELV